MIAVWLLSGWTLSIGWQVANLLAVHAFPGQAAPPSPTFPVTASAMVVTFVGIKDLLQIGSSTSDSGQAPSRIPAGVRCIASL